MKDEELFRKIYGIPECIVKTAERTVENTLLACKAFLLITVCIYLAVGLPPQASTLFSACMGACHKKAFMSFLAEHRLFNYHS
jgi:hypothetical protein